MLAEEEEEEEPSYRRYNSRCRARVPFLLPSLPQPSAKLIQREGTSYFVFEAARNDTLMNHFNPTLALGWLANIDISPCTSLKAVINYAAKYYSKAEKKSQSYIDLARLTLPGVSHRQPLISFASKIMNKLISERDYSAQEIAHLLLNIPLQEGTRVVIPVDCRPLDLQSRLIRLNKTEMSNLINRYQKYLGRCQEIHRI